MSSSRGHMEDAQNWIESSFYLTAYCSAVLILSSAFLK